MANQINHDDDAKFSFGVHEMRLAQLAHSLRSSAREPRVVPENHGSDPYNTSGSFDRKQHWARVAKR